METNDLTDDGKGEGALNVPELILGLSLIGLGAALVFRAFSKPGKTYAARYVPTDITFLRQGNQILATVKMDGPDPLGPVPMTVAYDPPAYAVSPPHTCTAAQNSPTASFTFTLGTIPPGQHLTVTVATVGCADAGCSVSNTFP